MTQATRQFTPDDALRVFAAVREEYQSARESFNLLLMGDHGTGKTWSMRNARRPVWIDCFDPGGTVSVRDCVKEGWMHVKRFDDDDIYSPHAFRGWEKHFLELRNSGFFNHVGTYVLDSVTTWSEALMIEVLHSTGKTPNSTRLVLDHRSSQKGGSVADPAIPELRDYLVQMKTMIQLLGLMTSLPCDFVSIAHIQTTKDEVSGRLETGPMVTGKLSQHLPLLFDEVYVARVEKGKYFYQIKNDGRYAARSRLFNDPEKSPSTVIPNIKFILKEVGYDHRDIVVQPTN